VARAAGATKFKFIATLQRASLRVGLEELEGEVTLFATIQRKLRTGEKYTVLDSMAGIALSALPRAERRKMEASMENDSKDFPNAVIGAPAAVVTLWRCIADAVKRVLLFRGLFRGLSMSRPRTAQPFSRVARRTVAGSTRGTRRT
jgi:hypothetical protein